MKAPKVLYQSFSFDESSYYSEAGTWSAESLYKQVKKEKAKPFKVPLACIDISFLPFSIQNLDDFIFHLKRVDNCDIKIPIIIGPLGTIMDGFHRIVKSIQQERRYIKAYKLTDLPEPDIKKDEKTKDI